MNKFWFAPLVVAAVVLALLGLVLMGAPTTSIIGWVHFAATALCVIGAVRSRAITPQDGAKRWLPWLLVFGGVIAFAFVARQGNLILLDAGTQATTPIERRARAEVAAAMKDPASVVFSDVKSMSSTACGRVNGRNGFGAYAGAVKFIWSEEGGVEVEGRVAPSEFPNVEQLRRCDFERMWALCQGVAEIPALDCSGRP